MGNLLAECQRCSSAQCDICGDLRQSRSGTEGSVSDTARGSRRQAGVDLQEYQPAGLSEADLLEQALQASRLGGGNGRREGLRGASAGIPAQRSAPGRARGSRGGPHEEDNQVLRTLGHQHLASEEELLAQALQRSKLEEEARQRARLLEEQAAEYEESLRIDRQRAAERALREKEEQEKLRQAEEEAEAQRREDERKRLEAEAAQQAEEARLDALLEEARSRLAPEPPSEEPGRVHVLIRVPDGRRLKRTFRSSDAVSQVYHYTNVEGGKALVRNKYRLVSAMPRKMYEDHEATLESVGLQGQCTLLVEIIDD